MKINRILLLNIVFVFSFVAYAQSLKVETVNRQNAIRCLNLSETSMLNSNWNEAIKQAELGLSYDNTISDLYYFKATAQSNMNYAKKDVLETIQYAFDNNNWVNYNENGARILLADLLSDSGRYQESLSILDDKNFIYSADSEVIRIKNYYRIGSPNSLNQARLRINSARRIYPNDERFPTLFFLFEVKFITNSKRNNISYKIPDLVQNIAESYVSKFPDYENPNSEIEMLASCFLDGEKRERFVRSISAKSDEYPLYALARLSANIITQNQALKEFSPVFSESISLDLLDNFVMLITEEEPKKLLYEYLNSFSGSILIDENLDLQNELVIKYERGRPSYVKYDQNNDGFSEIECECDFGAPTKIVFSNKDIELEYSSFPYVKNISYPADNIVYNFLYQDFAFSPFEISKDSIIQNFGYDFFVMSIKNDIAEPEKDFICKKCSSLKLPTTEYANSFVEYKYLNEIPVAMCFYEDDVEYAHTSNIVDNSFSRFVDEDRDGKFERKEGYSLVSYEPSESEKAYITKVFGDGIFPSNLILTRIEIDSNSNTIPEFIEEYFENNGIRTSWNSNDDDFIDVQYIQFDLDDGNSKIKHTIYYDSNGNKNVELISINDKPFEMIFKDNRIKINQGYLENVYWIGDVQTDSVEQKVYSNINKNIEQGVVELIESDEVRYFSIRIGSIFFIQKIEGSYIDEETEVEITND